MNVFCAQSDEGSFTQSRFTSMTSLAAAATCCAKRQRANQTQQNIFQFCGVAAKLKIHKFFFIKKLASKKNQIYRKKNSTDLSVAATGEEKNFKFRAKIL